MCESRGRKRAFISISSDEDEQEDEESGSESLYDGDCCDDNNVSSSSDDNDDESGLDDDEDVEDDYSSSSKDCDDEADKAEIIYSQILSLLREGSRLEELNLKECKTYLRKHKLRLSGTKAECINRIKEHWRIKDGNVEALYPRSSFNINCTGDVCKGDVVLFTQKVYQKFDQMKRSANIIGKRTIAGRITKESYGAAKQQHTFTVEVLWSKGIKKLPPLTPLLVKGRNLYRMKTFRQGWKNEAERLVVLAEKHQRGAAARGVRAMKKLMKTSTKAGGNHQKPLHHRLSLTSQSNKADKAKGDSQQQHSKVKKFRPTDHHKNSLTVKRRNLKKSAEPKDSKSCGRFQTLTHPHEVRNPTFPSHTTSSQSYYHTRRESEHQRAQSSFPFESAHTFSTMRLPHSGPYVNEHAFVATETPWRNVDPYPHYAFPNSIHDTGARSFSRFSAMNTFRGFYPPSGKDPHRPWN